MVRNSHLAPAIAVLLLLAVNIQSTRWLPASPGHTQHEEWHLQPAAIPLIAGSYGNLLATALWVDLIARFRPGDTDPAWLRFLARRLDAISRLNPKAEYAYYMAATLLPWAMKSTALSRPILARAMQAMPDDWRWPFYQGFNAYWFDNDNRTAFALLSRAAKLPGAPPVILRLAARIRLHGKSLDAAIAFLDNLLRTLKDPTLRKETKRQLRLALTEKAIRNIEARARKLGIPLTDPADFRKLGIPAGFRLPDGGRLIFRAGQLTSSAHPTRFRLYIPGHRKKYVRGDRNE